MPTTYRIYTSADKTAERVATAATLMGGSIYQVFPEKRNFASLDEWRRAYPAAYQTRRELNRMEKRLCGWAHSEHALDPMTQTADAAPMVSPVVAPTADPVATPAPRNTTPAAQTNEYLTRRQLGNIINVTCSNPDLDYLKNRPITMNDLTSMLKTISLSLKHNDFHDWDW